MSDCSNPKRLIFSFDVKKSSKKSIVADIINKKMLTAVQEKLQDLSKNVQCIQTLKVKIIQM